MDIEGSTKQFAVFLSTFDVITKERIESISHDPDELPGWWGSKYFIYG
jgi:hypothetical protein